MKNKFKYDVYIAGAMGGRSVNDVLNERGEAKFYLRSVGLTYYDPAEDEGLEKLPPDDLISMNYNHSTMKRFVKKDLQNVDKSRVVLNITGDVNSDGTSWEMARGRPVFCVAPKRAAGRLMGFTNILTRVHFGLFAAVSDIRKYLEVNKHALYNKRTSRKSRF